MFKTDEIEGCEMDSTPLTTSFHESGKSHNIKKAAEWENSKLQHPCWYTRDYNDPDVENTNCGSLLTKLRCMFLKHAPIIKIWYKHIS